MTSMQGVNIDIKLPRRSLLVQFTCDVCGERTKRLVNRLAYERGLIYVQVLLYFPFYCYHDGILVICFLTMGNLFNIHSLELFLEGHFIIVILFFLVVCNQKVSVSMDQNVNWYFLLLGKVSNKIEWKAIDVLHVGSCQNYYNFKLEVRVLK